MGTTAVGIGRLAAPLRLSKPEDTLLFDADLVAEADFTGAVSGSLLFF